MAAISSSVLEIFAYDVTGNSSRESATIQKKFFMRASLTDLRSHLRPEPVNRQPEGKAHEIRSEHPRKVKSRIDAITDQSRDEQQRSVNCEQSPQCRAERRQPGEDQEWKNYQVTDDAGGDYRVERVTKDHNRFMISNITQQQKREGDNREAGKQTDQIALKIFHSHAPF